MEYITEDIGYMEKPEVRLPAPGISGVINQALPLGNREASVNPMQIYLIIGAYIWLLGVMSMAVYSVISLWRLQKRLKEAVLEKGNIYRIRGKGAPFVYGLFCPRIYLPFSACSPIWRCGCTGLILLSGRPLPSAGGIWRCPVTRR